MTEFYRCACGYADTLEGVVAHVSHKINVEKDTRYYADGGHAVMLRAHREEQERAKDEKEQPRAQTQSPDAP